MPQLNQMYDQYSGEEMNIVGADYDPNLVDQSLQFMIKQQGVVVMVKEGRIQGCIAGHYVPNHFANELMFVAMFLYVRPGFRNYTAQFIRETCQYLQAQNTKRFIVSSPAFKHSDKLDRFYEMLGFELLEKHYYKILEHADAN